MYSVRDTSSCLAPLRLRRYAQCTLHRAPRTVHPPPKPASTTTSTRWHVAARPSMPPRLCCWCLVTGALSSAERCVSVLQENAHRAPRTHDTARQRGARVAWQRGATYAQPQSRVLLQKVHRAALRATSAAVARRSEVVTRGGATRATQACAAVAAWGCWCAAHGCANTPPTLPGIFRARRRCWCCVKPGTTQCAGRPNILARQRNMSCCWCKLLQVFRRTLPPFAAVLCAPHCLGAMPVRGSLSGGPSWARTVLVLL